MRVISIAFAIGMTGVLAMLVLPRLATVEQAPQETTRQVKLTEDQATTDEYLRLLDSPNATEHQVGVDPDRRGEYPPADTARSAPPAARGAG